MTLAMPNIAQLYRQRANQHRAKASAQAAAAILEQMLALRLIMDYERLAVSADELNAAGTSPIRVKVRKR
jgi:hypothetical protein